MTYDDVVKPLASNGLQAIDCQGFAGGFTLGMAQAGFDLVTKCEEVGGFGMANCLANRHLLGEKWWPQAVQPQAWEPAPAHVVFGNPPCSGFSLMSNKDFRGVNSTVNQCMWNFQQYVSRVNPYLAIFESVQPAFSTGLELMRALRANLELETGEQWTLNHILHNNLAVGGCSLRRRYFWCVSRIPFGIDPPEVTYTPTLHDAIADLQGLRQDWEDQPYVYGPSEWAAWRRRSDGLVDGHMGRSGPHFRRCHEIMAGAEWNWRENLTQVCKRYYERHGQMPQSWVETNQAEKSIARDFDFGYNQPVRWDPTIHARVTTGGALGQVVHPYENRFLTHREVARIQGFPDDWRIAPLANVRGLDATWGKGIPVDVGRWIGGWIERAIYGNPGEYTGEPYGEREFLFQFTKPRVIAAEKQGVAA